MDVISGDFYNFSVITFSMQLSLTTLINLDTLQTDSRAGAGEAKVFYVVYFPLQATQIITVANQCNDW